MHDDRNFVSESRVVGNTVRDGQRLDVAVAVFMLQTFTVQRGTTGGAADQEAARLLVARRPAQVADTLETEHGVVNVERDHRQVVGAVRRCRRQPGSACAQFVDAFLQDLAFLVFFIVGNQFAVLRGILLAVRAVDTNLTEQTFHTESTRFVGDDRNQPVFDRLVLQHHVQGTHKRDGGGNFLGLFFQQRAEVFQRRQFQLFVKRRLTARQITTQRLTTFVQVFVLFGIFIEGDERQFFNVGISHRHIETVAEVTHAVHVNFLNLVSDVLAFRRVAHPITLDGVRQNNHWFAFGVLRFFQCSKDFLRIVAATVKGPNLIVAPVCNQCGGFRVFTEEVLTYVGTIFRFEGLVVAVNGFIHQLDQLAAGVFTQQFIPTVTPHHLDHFPAGATEDAFQLVDDLAVAGNRAVQTLQVTVDDEHQVVQFFAGRDGDGAFRFRLVHLTVAQESINGLFRGIFQTTIFKIF